MGVLNVTPDSFSDGGQYMERDAAVGAAAGMASAGADLIDVIHIQLLPLRQRPLLSTRPKSPQQCPEAQKQ